MKTLVSQGKENIGEVAVLQKGLSLRVTFLSSFVGSLLRPDGQKLRESALSQDKSNARRIGYENSVAQNL